MAKKPTAVFKACGEEFATAEEAERHCEIVEAGQEFEQAAKRLARLVGKGAKTADGKPFQCGIMSSYWQVVVRYGSIPQLMQVRAWSHEAEFSTRDDGKLCYVLRDWNGRNFTDQYTRHPIDELYASEREAQKAYAAALDEWLKERTEEIAEIKAKWKL